METMTITDGAKKAVAALNNKAILVEYDIIFGYPKLIDHIVNFEKIKDDALIHDIEVLGKESLGHYSVMDALITRLGYKPVWQAGILPMIVDVLEIMESQLIKERLVRDIYQETKRFVLNNQKKVRAREFFGKIIRVREGVGEDIITADEIIKKLDRLILDEERHVRIVEDSIMTLNMYLKRSRG